MWSEVGKWRVSIAVSLRSAVDWLVLSRDEFLLSRVEVVMKSFWDGRAATAAVAQENFAFDFSFQVRYSLSLSLVATTTTTGIVFPIKHNMSVQRKSNPAILMLRV